MYGVVVYPCLVCALALRILCTPMLSQTQLVLLASHHGLVLLAQIFCPLSADLLVEVSRFSNFFLVVSFLSAKGFLCGLISEATLVAESTSAKRVMIAWWHVVALRALRLGSFRSRLFL